MRYYYSVSPSVSRIGVWILLLCSVLTERQLKLSCSLLHVLVWLGREISFCFQVSVVLAVFNAVESHIQARGSPAQVAFAVSLVMENSPFASPFPCWHLVSKCEHLPPASNPSPGWYWSAGFKAGVGFQSLLDHIESAVWRSGRVESLSFEAHLITSLHLLG